MKQRQKRLVKSFRVDLATIEKMERIAYLLNKDDKFWGNPHLQNIGFWGKHKVSNADVLEMAINEFYKTVTK